MDLIMTIAIKDLKKETTIHEHYIIFLSHFLLICLYKMLTTHCLTTHAKMVAEVINNVG